MAKLGSLIQRFALLLSCLAAVAAHPARLEENISQHYLSYIPQQQDFPNDKLYRAYHVIQRFKNTITSDAKNITATWTGPGICSETSYLGFYCAAPLGRTKELTVTAVLFNGFGLHAPKLQGFIDQLPDVALFHAASNNFGGNTPLLTGLAYLYNLNVAEDIQEKSSYPDTTPVMGYRSKLVSLNADVAGVGVHLGIGPQLGGRKPAGWTSSKALLLNYNNLCGPLPANLGFSKLSYLALANNNLTGPIPPSISQMQDNLLEVLLLNNQLSGCLPHELGMLHKAAVIDAGVNQLTGPIPSSFSCLSSVQQLNLAGNRLYGDVPDTLCKLAGPAGRLANLTLSGNYFTSVGPACAVLIKNGVLDVKNNCIPGLANQRRPAECAAFQSQPKTCPAATTQVTCPAATDMDVAVQEERKARDYSSYVTYATLHE